MTKKGKLALLMIEYDKLDQEISDLLAKDPITAADQQRIEDLDHKLDDLTEHIIDIEDQGEDVGQWFVISTKRFPA